MLPVARNIRVSPSARVNLLVRLHAGALPAGSMVRLDLVATSPSETDPTFDFDGPTVATAVFTSTSASAPQLVSCPLSSLSGGSVSLVLTASRGSVGTFSVTVSADLVLESHPSRWSPLALGSTLKLWLDNHDLVEVGGAYSDWGDQSDAANDFTQSTAGSRPVGGQNVNAEPAPYFDGIVDSLGGNVLSSFVSSSQYHVFVVVSAKAVVSNNATSYLNDPVLADGGLGWWGIFLKNNQGFLQVLGFHYQSGERVAVATGLALDSPALIEFSFDGATIRCRVGAEAIGTSAAGNIGSTAEFVNLGTGASGSPFLNGTLAAVVVCNSFLSDADVTAVRQYLSGRYGVAA